jgi:hypothetical protein
MTLDVATIKSVYSALKSHAKTLALFPAGVQGHEPLNAPPNGLSLAVVRGALTPIRASGLASTSARLEFAVRIYSTGLQQPTDGMDEQLLGAECALMNAYSGDFELDGVTAGLIRMIDLLGAYGAPLQSMPGWIDQDGHQFRTADITVPLILNDLFGQEA